MLYRKYIRLTSLTSLMSLMSPKEEFFLLGIPKRKNSSFWDIFPSWLGPADVHEEFQDLPEFVNSFVHVFNSNDLGDPEWLVISNSFAHVFNPSNFGFRKVAQNEEIPRDFFNPNTFWIRKVAQNRVWLEGFGRFQCSQLTQDFH